MIKKIFEVEFMNYTDSTQDAVCDAEGSYLDIRDKPVLMDEESILEFKHYGKGFRRIKFIGYYYKR